MIKLGSRVRVKRDGREAFLGKTGRVVMVYCSEICNVKMDDGSMDCGRTPMFFMDTLDEISTSSWDQETI